MARMPSRRGPRQEVMWFARKMEAELRKNDHKGGWESCHDGYLLRRIADERGELARKLRRLARKIRVRTGGALSERAGLGVTKAEAKAIVSEAADIANFAMMIADNWKYFTERE